MIEPWEYNKLAGEKWELEKKMKLLQEDLTAKDVIIRILSDKISDLQFQVSRK